MLTLNLQDTLTKIKIALDRREEPFLGYLAKFHKFVPLTDEMKEVYKIQEGKNEVQFLMGVNANAEIYYYEEDCKKLTERELCGLVAHELTHTMLRHTTHTPKEFDHLIANIAQDLVVNWHCNQADFKLPEINNDKSKRRGSLIPDSRGNAWFVLDIETPTGVSKVEISIKDIPAKHWIAIYREIIDQIKSNTGITVGTGGMTIIFDGIGKPDAHIFKSKPDSNRPDCPGSDEYWRFKVAEAAEHARQKGKLSGNFKVFLDKFFAAKIDWREKLKTAFITSVYNDITWNRPKRSAICRNIYLPTYYSEALKAVISVDSSGSISDKLLKQFMGEVEAILSACQSVDVDLLIGDINLEHYHITNENLETLTQIQIKGRGGTSHWELVKWINANASDAKLLITLTDGYSDIQSCFKELPPECKTIIVLGDADTRTINEMENFGQVIVIED